MRGPLVVVGGIPGAGKSTALQRAAAEGLLAGCAVVDTDAVRAWLAARLPRVPYPALRPLVHATHWARIVAVVLRGTGAVVVHDTATRGPSRAALRRLAGLASRPVRLVWIDTDPALARHGQVTRDRVIPEGMFAGHVGRVRRCDPAADATATGWDDVVRTDREGAVAAIGTAVGAARSGRLGT